MLETVHLAHLPLELPIYAAAYQNLENSKYIREQLLAGNQAFNYAFLDASTILSRKHLFSACFRAINDYMHDRLRSSNVQSEIVFCLSPNNNIGEAFKRFGLDDGTKDVLVVQVGGEGISADQIQEHLKANMKGQEVTLTDEWLNRVVDLDRLRKTYKLNSGGQPKNQRSGKQMDMMDGDNNDFARSATHVKQKGIEDLEAQVIGLMALRGAT